MIFILSVLNRVNNFAKSSLNTVHVKFQNQNSKLIVTAGRVIEKIKKESKNKVENYISTCPLS